MGDWRNAALQAAFWTYANSLRREAKLCDIILYVQGRKGAMVGYPAHKLLLISASKYFKLLFEREDLRNFCHFPHLSEDGLFTVLDIVYGREIADSVNLDDALMAARFLQVDCAVEELEAKRTALEAKARASPKLKKTSSSSMKRKAPSPVKHVDRKSPYLERDSDDDVEGSIAKQEPDSISMRIYKNTNNPNASENDANDSSNNDRTAQDYNDELPENDEGQGMTRDSSSHDPENSQDQDSIRVKMEPDVDLTMEDADDQQGFSHLSFGQGGAVFPNQGFAQMAMDNTSGTNESGLGMFSGQNSLFTGDGGGMPTFGDVGGYSGLGSGMDDDSQNMTDKKRQCDICGKVFATARHLEDHKAVHTAGERFSSVESCSPDQERRYVCDLCGRAFKTSRDTRRHRMTHTGERHHTCIFCKKSFTRMDNLMVHMRRCKLMRNYMDTDEAQSYLAVQDDSKSEKSG